MTRSPRGYEDAADGPHVDLGVVVLLQENELGRAVPARHHVLRQLPLHRRFLAQHTRALHVVLRVEGGEWLRESLWLPVLGVHLARETEDDDLNVALAVYQDVGGLQVAVDQVPALHVEQAAEELVQE